MSKLDKKVITIVIGSFKIGGAERMAINIGEELLQRGYDVHFALLRPIFEIPNQIPDDRIHLLSKRKGRSSKMQHVSNLFNLFKLNLTLKSDFVVGFTYFSSFVACFSLCNKVIATFDVFPYQFAKKRARVANFVIKWPYVKKIVCPSQGLLDQVVDYKPSFAKKGTYIYNTLDYEGIWSKSNAELDITPNLPQKYIVAMGRFSKQKNFGLLLEAYAKSKIREQFKLVLIGDGPLKSDIHEIIDKYSLNKDVYLTGFLPNPFQVIKNAKLFINTSDYESFCMVILESLSLNVPVIAADCKSGPSEMVQSGLNGMLFPVGKVDHLISILNQITDAPEIVDMWRNNISESIKKFRIEAIVDKWEAEIFN
ncbi:glycosyltransferase [Fulvivirga maritima]|uniref:glycosyltransferase n=1 Tax=Fulvivirga maritima TaxID=2904247 RepID=UPI001F2550E7|nr:glycosyltransferase [Fulvivirga maritima]UII24838.1 glycosyltransferase [Fulvivirga maritima]